MEIIKKHHEFEGYHISNLGYIIGPRGLIRPNKGSKRATNVRYSVHGVVWREESIQRAVATSFLLHMKEDWHDTVAFMDGDFGNCSVENIFWTTRSLATTHHLKMRKRLC